MKKETDTVCQQGPGKKCLGATFSIKLSRAEQYLGHRAYKCDSCGTIWKFTERAQP